MSLMERTEQALARHFDAACGHGAPPRLVEAMRHAVFSGGARIRPQLCMAVAVACGDDRPELTDAAAVALELMHCASLVHDDMPAFDDADTRRGRPTVHKAFSEPLALLAGDGLIVMAYRVLLQGAEHGSSGQHQRLALLMDNLTRGVGLPLGIGRPLAVPARQNRRAVCVGHLRRRHQQRQRPHPLGRAGRSPRRGLPGGR